MTRTEFRAEFWKRVPESIEGYGGRIDLLLRVLTEEQMAEVEKQLGGFDAADADVSDPAGDAEPEHHEGEPVNDDGCLLHANQASLFISSLGELSRYGADAGGSLRLDEVAARKGFDWKTVSTYYGGPGEPEEATRWFATVRAAEEDRLRQSFSPEERRFIHRVEAYKEAIGKDRDRFRIYGARDDNGAERVIVVTEFVGFIDDAPFWDALQLTVAVTGAHVWVMNEHPHINRYRPAGALQWIEGPDHGRMERQVELSWRIEAMDIPAFQDFLNALRAATVDLWKTKGVSVI